MESLLSAAVSPAIMLIANYIGLKRDEVALRLAERWSKSPW